MMQKNFLNFFLNKKKTQKILLKMETNKNYKLRGKEIIFFLRQDKRKLISKLRNVNGNPEKDSRK